MHADEDDLKRLYALLAEGKIDDEAAQAAAEAVEARRRRHEGVSRGFSRNPTLSR